MLGFLLNRDRNLGGCDSNPVNPIMRRTRKDATPPDTPLKKERLTLTQLAGYDDILTDALVDHVRLNRSTRRCIRVC